MKTHEFEKALSRLKEALALPKDEIVRDSVIQRFEFTMEFSWKTAKKIMGTNTTIPKLVIREMADGGLIADPKIWFDYLEARNLSSHTYKEALAEQVYDVAKKSISDFEMLLKKLKDLE